MLSSYVYLLYYVCIAYFDVEYIFSFVMLGVCKKVDDITA